MNKGINLIKQFEGCRLAAYKCPSGVLTIGWGHTKGVKIGDTCTQEQADKWLADEVQIFENAVKNLVNVPLNENQLGALTSFVYNVGIGNFSTSTLRKKLNAKDYTGAANEFERWVYGANKRKLEGLVRRRKAEKELFLK